MSPPLPPSPGQRLPPTQTYPAPAPASGDAVPTVPRETMPMPGGAFPPAPPPFVLRSAPRAPVSAVPLPVVPPPAPRAPAPVARPVPALPAVPQMLAPPARAQRPERKPAIYVQRPGPLQQVSPTRGNAWAVACLLCALSDVVFFPLFFISAPLGVVSGHLARRASRRDPTVNNRVMTTISLVVNYLFLLGGVGVVLAFLLALI